MPVVLAHGALGIFDEVIFVSVAAIFLVMMGISWVRSRSAPPKLDPPEDAAPAAPAEADPSGRFKLD